MLDPLFDLLFDPLFDRATGYPMQVSALVWWLIPLVACTGALIYVWWSITSKRRQNTYKTMSEYETFRSAFEKDEVRYSTSSPTTPTAESVQQKDGVKSKTRSETKTTSKTKTKTKTES